MYSQTKRQKCNHLSEVLAYPHIPESAQDREENSDRESWQKCPVWRRIERTESNEWGNSTVAAARADLEPKVTQANEQIMRTYHSSLSCISTVYAVTEGSRNCIWVVMIPTAHNEIKSTHAGNREIHIIPKIERPNPLVYLLGTLDLVGRRINPRRMLTPHDLNAIRSMFPTAVGVRILIAGWAIVLFNSKSSLYAAWKDGIADTIGELSVCYDILDHTPTIATTMAGCAVADKPENYNTHGALGLRVKLANGVEAITTVTHGFVQLPYWSPMILRVADWILRAKKALSNFRPMKPTNAEPAEVTMKGEAIGNSPLGHEVWLAGTNQLVGTISYTYDKPSRFLPYPSGYSHDLSLITSTTLPLVQSPLGVGEVDGWANYEDALDGQSVFTCLFNVWVNKTQTIQGDLASRATQKAVVIGSEYLWVEDAVSQSASILWRTEPDDTTASGWSGSALCVGKPTDKYVKALVFQNFQKPVTSLDVAANDRKLSGNYGCCIKGGFVLPQEIRDSEISRGEPAERIRTRNWASNPFRSRYSGDNERRNFSSPS